VSGGGSNAAAPPGDPPGALHVQFELPSYSVSEAPPSPGAPSELRVKVVLDGVSPGPVAVFFSTAGGSARPTYDYVHTNGWVHFDPGVTAQWVSVRIIDHNRYEAPEQFNIQLSNSVGALLGPNFNDPVTLPSDDASPTVSFTSSSYESTEPGGLVRIGVHLSTASDSQVAVRCVVGPSTSPTPSATPGADFLASVGDLVFLPGQQDRTFFVAVYDDTITEPDEYVDVAAVSATNATVPGGQIHAPLTIHDNDGRPKVRFHQPAYANPEAEPHVRIQLAVL